MNVRARILKASPRGLLLIALIGLAGCPSEPAAVPTAEALPFAGQEITIRVPPELGFRDAWTGPLNEWEAQAGARSRLEEVAWPDEGNSTESLSGATAPTLLLFPLERAGELIAAGRLAPIPDALRGAGDDGLNLPDLFQGLRERIVSRKSQPLFLPLSAPVLVCACRQDLLQAAGLSPPKTWEDYHELIAKLPEWAPGLTAVEPWSPQFRATMFLARAVALAQAPGQYSLFFDIDTGAPLIDSPAFVRALQQAQDDLRHMPAQVLSYAPADCRRELREGRAALIITCLPDAGSSTPADATGTEPAGTGVSSDQIAVIPLPISREYYDASRQKWEPLADKGASQVTLTGFSGWGIGATASSSPAQIETAWNALIKVAGADLTSGFPEALLGPCRETHLNSGRFSTTLFEGVSTAGVQAVAHSLRSTRLVAELPVAGRDEFRHVLTTGLDSVLEGAAAPEATLQAVASGWQAIIERIGPARHRDNYRSSLGLSPKPAD